MVISGSLVSDRQGGCSHSCHIPARFSPQVGAGIIYFYDLSLNLLLIYLHTKNGFLAVEGREKCYYKEEQQLALFTGGIILYLRMKDCVNQIT